MKNIKKLLALVLALAICAAFALPALAADGDTGYSLTMKNPQPEHSYKLYQIFTGTVSEDEKTLSDIQWGSAWENNPRTDKAATVAKDLTTAKAMEDFLAGLDTKTLIPYSQDGLTNPQVGVNENTSLVWNNLPGGYYMVVDETDDDEEAPASRIMAIIVGAAEVTTKPSEPTIEKKVAKLAADGVTPQWKEGITAALEETYQFQLLANVNKTNLERFVNRPGKDENGNPKTPSYPLTFTDNMTNMIYESIVSVKILKADKSLEKELSADDYTITRGEGDKSFTLTVDLLADGALGADITQWPDVTDFYVEVIYKSKLTADAVVYPADGNINVATLDYYPDPESDGPSTTPPDDAKVFPFEIEGSKIDGESKEGLNDATFNIYKLENDQEEVPDGAQPLKFVYDSEKMSYVLCKDDAEGASPNVTARDKGDAKGKFNFYGLDQGKYALRETVAPDGYNKITEDIIVTITATQGEDGIVTSVKHTQTGVVNEDGSLKDIQGTAIEVVNNSGSTLPSTGGIGTTIFYIVGAVLVVGAGVLLFTKRRIKG